MKKNFRIQAIAGLGLLGLAAWAEVPAAADVLDMSLEELMNIPVSAASGFAQSTADAPAAVTIVTRQDIQAFGYRTLADALASVAGFYGSYDRTYQALGVRGFNRPGDYNTRTLILINGVRVNDSVFSQGLVGTELPIDLDLVERIEVVRGPSSSLYGSSAFFGVINVVTRAAKDVGPAEAAASAGSYDAYSGRFSFGQAFGDRGSLLLSGSLLKSAGDDLYFPLYDNPETNGGVAEGRDGEQVGTLFLQAKYAGFALQAAHMDRTKELPTAAYGTIFNDPAGENRDRETMADLSWEGELAPDWEGLARLGYQRYEYGADWPYDNAEPGQPLDRVVNEDIANSDSVGGEVRVTTEALARNRITAGAEVRHAFRLNQQYVASGETVLDSREEQTDFGVYLQDEIRLAPWALLNAGLRYDRMEPYGDDAVSPRTALIFTPVQETVLKLIYGEAFRAPNAFERFYGDGGVSLKPNPELEPETIRTVEAVWEQRVAAWFQLNVSVYRYDIEDLITQETDAADDLLVYRNVDQAEAFGGEIEGILDLPGDVRARGSYAYCRAEDATTGERLDNSPAHLAKLNLRAPLFAPNVTLGPELQYASARKSVDGTEVDGALLVNVTLLACELKGGFDLALSVYNLFDEDYADPVGEEILGGTVQQNGRTFQVKATVRF